MKHLAQIGFFIAGLTLLSGAVQAQTKIQSKEDYKNISKSITEVSRKLYPYSKQYPKYAFATQYNEAGELTGIFVTGVSDKSDAEKIKSYLMQLEVFGALVREMDANYLPEIKGDVMKSVMSELEAKEYKPSFDGNALTSAR
jgi:hypothetical protein